MPTPPSGTVTFLLTDIEGSTSLWERDPAMMREALAWHDATVRDAIERRGGYVFATGGDSFAAAFGDPISGAAAAVEIQETMGSRDWGDLGVLKVRMGLDAGIAEERDGDYFGPPVNRAARIMSLASGGEVLASHTAADLLRHHLEEGIRLEDVGERELRGVSRSETVFAVAYGPPSPTGQARRRKVPWLWIGVGAVGAVAVVVFVLLAGGGGESPAAPSVAPTNPAPQEAPTRSQPTAATTASPQSTTPPAPAAPTQLGGPRFALESLGTWVHGSLGDSGSGGSPSVAIGRDGEKVVVFNNPSTGDLRIAVCRDPSCRAVTRKILDDGGVGEWASAAIGVDGFAVVSYYDRPNQDLKVAHCEDRLCGTFSVTVVDAAGAVGSYGSLVIGRDGLPVVSYFDEGNSMLKVAHCETLNCSIAATVVVDSSGDAGSDTAIAIGGDGLPVISYNDRANGALRVAHCDALDCSAATITTVDTDGPAGLDTAIAIGNGLPLVTYRAGLDVVLVRCDDAFCASSEVILVASLEGGPGTAVGFGAGGVPLVAYHHAQEGAKLARCTDFACSSVDVFSVDGRPGAGVDPSLAVLPSGLPILAYYDNIDVRAYVALPEAVAGQ